MILSRQLRTDEAPSSDNQGSVADRPGAVCENPYAKAACSGKPAVGHEILLDPRYFRSLRSYFRRRGCSHETAEDLAQEVIVKVISYCSSNVIFVWKAFIYRIAANLLRDHMRASCRSECSLEAFQSDGEYPPADALIETITPEHLIAGRAALASALAALDQLDGRTRSVFILHRLDGMRHREIAARLGISISLVEKSIARAALHLQNACERQPIGALCCAGSSEAIAGPSFAENVIDSLLASAHAQTQASFGRNGESAVIALCSARKFGLGPRESVGARCVATESQAPRWDEVADPELA